MTTQCLKKSFYFSIFALLLFISAIKPQSAHAEIVYSENFGYYIDLPEAFILEDQSADETSLFFTHSFMPVYLAIRVYNSKDYSSAQQALTDVLTQMKATKDVASFSCNGVDSALSNFSVSMPDKSTNEGWASAFFLPEKNNYVVFLCYAPSAQAQQCSQFILSVIDSVNANPAGFSKPGLVTTFAYPGTKPKQVNLNISGKKFTTLVDFEDAEAAKFVVDREYSVLTLYANHDLWKEAWQRYYRMIYRDSYSRLNQASADIYKNVFPIAIKKDGTNAEKAYAQELLSWTQDFVYSRDRSNSDFTDLISALGSAGCDCDSRSLLLCVLLKHTGTESALFVSREYSHAVAGFAIDANGAKININGTDFLLAETTAHVNIGLIAQDMKDTEKWIPIELP